MQNVYIELAKPEIRERSSTVLKFSPHVKYPLSGRNVEFTGKGLFEIVERCVQGDGNLKQGNSSENGSGKPVKDYSPPTRHPTSNFLASDVRTTVTMSQAFLALIVTMIRATQSAPFTCLLFPFEFRFESLGPLQALVGR
jgi:hypothetical protein